jgi:hypothetical protein
MIHDCKKVFQSTQIKQNKALIETLERRDKDKFKCVENLDLHKKVLKSINRDLTHTILGIIPSWKGDYLWFYIS